ncbi:hypothetical protein [Sorangium sp. So ce1078]|uniref:hypothetical protein n=1 Tax=Sorangium sp. So ce1078 TaxID=3133329 RepID=UPI003F648173
MQHAGTLRAEAPVEMTRVQMAVVSRCSSRLARSAAPLELRELVDDAGVVAERDAGAIAGGDAGAVSGDGRSRERDETCARAASRAAAAGARAMPSA